MGLAALVTLWLCGCGAAPKPSAINQLGKHVEAGRETAAPRSSPPSHPPAIHSPYAIAAAVDGLWFTEYSAPMLGMMELSGAFRRISLDQEGFPERLAVAHDGAVWFTDPQGERIGRVLPYNGRVDYYPVPTPKSGPAGIAAAPDGSIWFTEHAAGQIGLFVPPDAHRPSSDDHRFMEFPLPRGGGPAGIVVASDGAVWFAENSGNRIGRLVLASGSRHANITEYPLPFPDSHPNGVALGDDGEIYFTELAASRIGRLDSQGHLSEMVLPVNAPALDIIAGADSVVWLTVPRAHAICRVRAGDTITAFYLPETAIPAFIAGGADGNLYFTEPTGKIARFTPAGVLTEVNLAD